MKKNVPRLRPSPNEEARIIREEQERRRKLRIQQVREQQRHIASQIRREVEQRRQQELQRLEQELRKEWEDQQREKLHTLQRLYQESLELLGQGHRSAKENERDLAAIAQKEEENHTRAEERYREALKELKAQKIKDHEKQNQLITARKKALQAEKERSAKVARLPLPPPNPVQNISPKKPRVVRRSDLSAFADTHYHMHKSTVDREVDTHQPDAHEEAELHVRRQQDLEEEGRRRREEQLEKAHVRGRQALRREQLLQDRERWLVELEHLQQADLLRRRQQVSQMPPQIFQPLYKRQQMGEDFQRELEFAFEDMYTGERRVKGDLVVQLAPEPLPARSTSSQDAELDVTLDEGATQRDAEEEPGSSEPETPGSSEPETPAQVGPPKAAPRQALKKLLDRIRSQRSLWTERSSSAAVFTDQIPERDTTIETGSLITEDTRVELREAAGTQLPHVLATRIQELEEERKKREAELELEKQQQMVLLRELEEQKARLEQVLLEAQQEAAVTRDHPCVRGPARGHDACVSPHSDTGVAPPAGEDEHSRRIRDYQQQLLEQNRVQHRVEEARRCLEEYQRALQVRYSATVLPAAPPPGLSHPPPHSTRRLHRPRHVQLPPAPLQLPPAPLQVPPAPLQLPPAPLQLPPALLQVPPAPLQLPLALLQVPPAPLQLPPALLQLPPAPLQVPPAPLQVPPAPLQLPLAPLQLPLAPAGPMNNGIPHTTVAGSTGESDTFTPLLSLPGSSPASNPLPDEGEFASDGPRCHRLNDASRLTDTIMEKVTEHLPQRVRPSSLTKKQLPCQLFTKLHSREGPLQSASAPVRAVSSDPAEAALSCPGGALAEPRASLCSLSREADGRRRQEEAVMEQQEEARRRQERAMAQMRRQKEALQALINPDPEPAAQPDGNVVPSGNVNENRLQLLASLLKAIEESSGGTLAHLEDGQPSSHTVQSDAAGPALPSGALGPAAKPPVTRVRLGLMTEQHQLSAIQEAETSADGSRLAGPDDAVPSHTALWEQQDEPGSSGVPDRTLQTPSAPSRGQETSERSASSGTTSSGTSWGRSSLWRERLLLAASPESSVSDSVPRRKSPVSSDSGRGADFSGPPAMSCGSPTESPNRPGGSDSFPSTTISTGSYVTSDPEQRDGGASTSSFWDAVGGSSSVCGGGSSAGPPAACDDSSVERVISRYTQELHLSLSRAGRADREGSGEDGGSASIRGRRGEDQSSGPSAGPQGGAQDSGTDPTVDGFWGAGSPPAEDSFRPLIGQLADQSSCLSEQRHSALERLVGHPSAHSSMIGHSPGQLFPLTGQGGWDSALSRMIGRFSHQSGSHWLSGVQDFYAGHLMMSQQSTSWLADVPNESQMRPLVGELDESVQDRGNSGERGHVALCVSDEVHVSQPALPPEASVTPHLQDPPPGRAEDWFHPLVAEVTHNGTADLSVTFDQLQSSADGPPARSAATPDPPAGAAASPECLRAEEPNHCAAASSSLQGSFLQLVATPRRPQGAESPATGAYVEQTAARLSDVSMCDDAPAQVVSHPERLGPEPEPGQASPISRTTLEAATEKGILEQSQISLLSLTHTTLQDQDTTEGEEPDGRAEEGQEGREVEEDKRVLMPEGGPGTGSRAPADPGSQWALGPGQQHLNQQRLAALLHRSNRRVEQLRAKAARRCRASPERTEQPEANAARPGPEPQHSATSEGGPQHTEKSGSIRQQRPQLLPPVNRPAPQRLDGGRMCSEEQRRHHRSEMHQRTQRLYEQLEEVKQQKVMKTRQEHYAQNRLKAKEFHKKTLQKLRAKQSQQGRV